ncbi:hypothetical protein R6Q57_018686 [Mikania cordata]
MGNHRPGGANSRGSSTRRDVIPLGTRRPRRQAQKRSHDLSNHLCESWISVRNDVWGFKNALYSNGDDDVYAYGFRAKGLFVWV